MHQMLAALYTCHLCLLLWFDANWAGCPDRASQHLTMSFFSDNLVSMVLPDQVSGTSAQAEYRVVANTVTVATCMREFLLELSVLFHRAMLV